MKLVRYGAIGQEKPGLIDKSGQLRDLSGHVRDFDGEAYAPASLAKLAALDTAKLPAVGGTPRLGAPQPGVLPTTHSLGQLARAVLRPLPPYVHAYFHDYDLLDAKRRTALLASLAVLGRRRYAGDPRVLAR